MDENKKKHNTEEPELKIEDTSISIDHEEENLGLGYEIVINP